MDCGGCGAQNRDDAAFCATCGGTLSVRCASCARELAADARFCDGCGTPVPAAGPTPAAVRKTVTAMFCDLGGSTGFGERVDAESARSVIGDYHAMLQAEVDAYGGTLAKFIGDGMLAYFGIPEVAEDDAERAVAAAAAMQRRFGAFATEVAAHHGETLTFRIGVNSGEVVIGEGDADVVGDALNVAARLEKACAPGRVLVGEATWRLTRGTYGFEPLGAVEVAGRTEPVSAYVLVDETRDRTEAATPFVGRDGELARLRSALDGAVADRSARFVTVIGPPGVGKTRLSRELEHSVAGEATVLHTACERSGAATFAPLVDLIRPTIGLVDGLDDEATRAKLAEIVPPDEPARERDRIVDGLAGIVGVGEARSTEETFWAVRRLIESLAATRPVVLVIDDIQWAESLLLDLLEHLAEWVTDAAVLVIGLARPELRDLRPAMAEPGRRMADVVVLDGLDADATALLATRMLGGDGLPPELLARLPASTDGNPLFVRELVRMLVDEEIIRRDGDTWRLTVDVEAVEVPPTIRSLLAARIERLPVAERTVLERASVIGADFTLDGLRALIDDPAAVEGHLERLRRRDLVEPTGSYWGDDPQFRFHHVLIRDAVYGRLLKETRADLHERIGDWTETAAARVVGEYGPAVAHHFELAHAYLGQLGALDDHGRTLGRRAAELLTSASERALERDDIVAAGTLAIRALACLDDADRGARAELLLLACEAVLASGDLAPAARLVDELALLGADDDRLAAWADTYRAQLIDLTDPGRLDEAETLAVAAADWFVALGDGSGQAKAHLVRAGLMARRGQVAESEAELDLALGAAREAGDQRRLVAVLGVAPAAALWGPSPVARAGGRCLDVIRLLRITAASPAVEATSTRHQAVLEALRGRFDTARSLLASARATVEELGLHRDLMEVELFTGLVALLAQDPAAAEGPLRIAHVGLADMGVGADAALASAHLARALLVQGRTEEAEALAAGAAGSAGQGLKAAIAWRSVQARLRAAAGDAEGAVAMAEEAVALARDTDLLLDHADAWTALADVRAIGGDGPGATAARVEADRLYGLKGSTVHLVGPASVDDAAGPPERDPSSADGVENMASRRTRDIVARWMADGPEAVRDLVTEQVLWEDRRPGLGAVAEGRDARIEGLRAVTELLGESPYEVFDVVAQRGERLTLMREGVIGDYVVVNLGLAEYDYAGLQCRLTLFDADDLPAAMAELEARYMAGEGAAPEGPAENRGGRVSDPPEENLAVRSVRAGLRRSQAEGPEAIRDLFADDVVIEDRRAGVSSSGVGPDLLMANVQAIADLMPEGHTFEIFEVVAQRGERLALVRLGVRGDIITVEALGIVGLDEEGRQSHRIQFDADDLAAALEELDALYLAGEGAAHARVLAVQRAWIAASVARDWDAVTALFSPEFQVLDHRALGFGALAREEWVQHSRSRFDLAEDVVMWCPWFQVDGPVISMAIVGGGTGPGGTEVEWTSRGVLVTDLERGVWTSGDVYAGDDAAGAEARFEELTAAGPAESRASLQIREMVRRWMEEGPEAVRDLVADDYHWEDRRPGLTAVVDGAEAFTESLKAATSILVSGTSFRYLGVVAQRGDRLGLVRLGVASAELGLVVEMLELVEIDDHGRGTVGIVFEPESLTAALEELDARYLAGEVAANDENRAARMGREFILKWMADGADSLRDRMTTDVVYDDRRAGLGDVRVGVDAVIENLQSAAELIGDGRFEVFDVVAQRGEHLAVFHQGVREPFEVTLLTLAEFTPEGLQHFVAHFDPGDLAAAIAEMESRALVGLPGENLAAQQAREFARLWREVGPDAVRDVVVEDHRWEDRRPGLATVVEGVDDYIENLRVASSVMREGSGFRFLGTMAQRGTKLAVVHLGIDNDDLGLVVDMIGLVEVDETGRETVGIVFAPEDLSAAFEEMEARYLAGEGAPGRPGENLAAGWGRAFVSRWMTHGAEAMRALMVEDIRFEDRREGLGHASVGADAMIDNLGAIRDVLGDDVFEVFDVVAHRGDLLALFEQGVRGEIEVMVLLLIEFTPDGRQRRLVGFDPDSVPDALDLLDVWFAEGQGSEHAAELEVGRRVGRAIGESDAHALELLLADGFAIVDHRLLGWGTPDEATFLAAVAARPETLGQGVIVTPRFLRIESGGLLGPFVIHSRSADGIEGLEVGIVLLLVRDSRLARMEMFDEGAEAEAEARFDALLADPRLP